MDPSSASTSYRLADNLPNEVKVIKICNNFQVEQMSMICHVLYHTIEGEVPMHSAI